MASANCSTEYRFTTTTHNLLQTMDPQSGIPWKHLSFILRYYMLVDETTPLEQEMRRDVNHGHILFTGSARENLYLPFKESVTSDIDMMMVPDRFYVLDTDIPAYEEVKRFDGFVFCMKYSVEYPCYINLYECRTLEEESTVHISPVDATVIQKFVGLSAKRHYSPSAAYQHGPAVTVIRDKARDELPEELREKEILVEEDYVLALPCSSWPRVARSWEARVRARGCIGEDVIRDILDSGCHVVPVGIREVEESYWRLSFSIAEVKLARSLTQLQRRCYLLFKSIHTVHLKELKTIVTYQLKNLLFWECEKLDRDKWTMDKLANCTLRLLDALKQGLENCHIPHYFVPENNLIGMVDKDLVQKAIKKIEWVLQNPIQAFRECDAFFRNDPMKFHRFDVVESAISNKEFDNETCFRTFHCDMIVACVQHDDIGAALLYMKDSLELLIPGDQGSLRLLYALQYASNTAADVADLQTNIRCYKIVLEAYKRLEHSDDNKGACLNNLAILLHSQLARNEEGDNEEGEESLLPECDALFKEAMRVCNDDESFKVNYANWLLYTKRYSSSLNILREVCETEEKSFDTVMTFHKLEISSLPKAIQEIYQGGQTELPLLVCATFIKILCHCEMGSRDQARESMRRLERLAVDKGNAYTHASQQLVEKALECMAKIHDV